MRSTSCDPWSIIQNREVHVIVTDQGLEDLRGLDAREKVPVIIE